MENHQIQAALKELQDAMVVMAHMEARQPDRLMRQEREIEDLSLARARVDQSVLRLREESAIFQRRAEQNLAEITDKLNATGLDSFPRDRNNAKTKSKRV
jgi:hypothetical protein